MKNENETMCRRIEMKILTHLTGNFYLRQGNDEKSYSYDNGRVLDGRELVRYENAIRKAVDRENRPEFEGGEPCNLMDEAFDGSQSIKEKAEHAMSLVENINGILFGCFRLQLKEYLEFWELREVCEYIGDQYAEGWGEGLFQRDIQVEDGILNVVFSPQRNVKGLIPGVRKMQEKRIQEFIDDAGYSFYFQYKEYMKPIKSRLKDGIEEKDREVPKADDKGKPEGMLTVSEYFKLKSANKNKTEKKNHRREDICR